jgi:hypothetical protein
MQLTCVRRRYRRFDHVNNPRLEQVARNSVGSEPGQAVQHIHQTRFPEAEARVRSGEVASEIIEGEGALRFAAQSVPASGFRE